MADVRLTDEEIIDRAVWMADYLALHGELPQVTGKTAFAWFPEHDAIYREYEEMRQEEDNERL